MRAAKRQALAFLGLVRSRMIFMRRMK